MSAPPQATGGGGFRLKIKLNGPPSSHLNQSSSTSTSSSARPPPPTSAPTYPPHPPLDQDDEQEDQLASSDLAEHEDDHDEQEDDNTHQAEQDEDEDDPEEDHHPHHPPQNQNDHHQSLSPAPATIPAPLGAQPPPAVPLPPPPPPPTSRPNQVQSTNKRLAKSKTNPSTKKRKTLATSQPSPIHHPLAHHPHHPPHHHHLIAEDNDSEPGSYTSDQTHQPPKARTIKHSNVNPNPRTKPSPNMIPLTDAELLSAAGSQYPPASVSSSGPLHSTTAKSKTHPSTNPPLPSSLVTIRLVPKKKKSNLEASKKKNALSNIPLAPEPSPDPRSNFSYQSVTRSVSSPHPQPVNVRPAAVTKGKVKKGPRLAKSKDQDPFQSNSIPSGVSTPIFRPPPQPRQQHDYSLGPPPPPPVPAFRPAPIGPAPRPQGQFLPAQPLEKRTPRVRSWKKVRREVIGISGIPFWIWTHAGEEHSDYAIFKQTKLAQGIGTPTSNNETQYFPSAQPSRPASVASSHAKPSPIRNSSGTRASKYVTNDLPAANLGGPVLPASFRRPPMSIGSPLSTKSNDPTNLKAPNPQDAFQKSTTPLIARGSKSRDSSTPSVFVDSILPDDPRNPSIKHPSVHQPIKSKPSQLDHPAHHPKSSLSELNHDTGVIKLPQLAIPK